MSLSELISIIIAVLAVIISVVSLIRTRILSEKHLKLSRKQIELQEQQTGISQVQYDMLVKELNDKQLPYFIVTESSTTDDIKGNSSYRIRIKNIGNPAQNVVVVSDPVIRQLRDIDVIQSMENEEETLIEWDEHDESVIPDQYVLELQYMDTEGQPHSRSFVFIMNKQLNKYFATTRTKLKNK